jgi:ParB family transcriptional regulator, chromosome partitioning protein
VTVVGEQENAMTTGSAAAGKVVERPAEKEKVEKRRALGRGLESLLPGPRAVSTGLRVPGTEHAGPQGLKPPSSPAQGGRAEEGAEKSLLGRTVTAAAEAGDESAGGDRSGEPLRHPKADSGSSGASEVVAFAGSVGDAVEGSRDPEHAFPPFAKVAKGRAPTFGDAPADEQHVPQFVRNDRDLQPRHDDGRSQAPATVEEIEARVSASHQDEGISIQAVAMPSNLVVNLDMELIEKNPFQTRYMFDEEQLEELRDSIKEHGVVQPIVVRPTEDEGSYILVLGERRLRASKMAGMDTIPAVVKRVSPQQAAEMTVLENVMREDLNPLEQAEAFRVLSTQFNMTQAEIADRVGVSREKVSNYMRLLKLPKKVMEYLLSEQLSYSDCREILVLDDFEQIEQLAEEVVTKHLKWDEIERRVSEIKGFFPAPETKKKSGGARWVDPNVRAAQTEMERTLGMRVRIRDRNGKGRIVIEYASVDEYERVVEVLRGRKK